MPFNSGKLRGSKEKSRVVKKKWDDSVICDLTSSWGPRYLANSILNLRNALCELFASDKW